MAKAKKHAVKEEPPITVEQVESPPSVMSTCPATCPFSEAAFPVREDLPVDLPPASEPAPAVVSPAVAEAGKEVFDEDFCGALYDGLGLVEAFVFGRVFGLTQPQAKTVFEYSAAEKRMLTPATARVLQKYAPAWAEKYAEEIGLAFLLTTITAAKVQAAIALASANAERLSTEGAAGAGDGRGHRPDSGTGQPVEAVAVAS